MCNVYVKLPLWLLQAENVTYKRFSSLSKCRESSADVVGITKITGNGLSAIFS